MRKSKYKVTEWFQVLDRYGDWIGEHSEGDTLYRVSGSNNFEDEDGNTIAFRQKDIKDYLKKVVE